MRIFLFILAMAITSICFSEELNIKVTVNKNGSVRIVNTENGLGIYFNNSEMFQDWINESKTVSMEDGMRASVKDILTKTPVLTGTREYRYEYEKEVTVRNAEVAIP